MKKILQSLLIGLPMLGLCGNALASMDISLDHGAVWQTKKAGNSTEGFLQIHNDASQADVLTGWSCPLGDTELVGANGQALQNLRIPARQTVVLSATGLHLLLEHTKDSVDFGSVVPCSFTFQNAGEIGGYLNAVSSPKS